MNADEQDELPEIALAGDLTDREASFVAAEYIRERLEEEDERPLYDVPHEEVTRLIELLGIK